MNKYGIEFGAHTLTHFDLTRLPTSDIETEMRESKDGIEQISGAIVSIFAYPYGRFNKPSHAIAQGYFVRAASSRLDWAHNNSNVWALERLDAYYLKSGYFFHALSTSWFHQYISLRRLLRNVRLKLLLR